MLNSPCFPVVKRNQRGDIMTVFAVCTTREQADLVCERANKWYGELHPLTPLEVVNSHTCFLDPKPFPEMNYD